ncbi:MAG: asparagine synthetase B [Cellvibrionaceae bacterium]|nr:asparagine synthetase B [Cellvibrionaceae bacterium]|tara:strand:- start:30983 stop:32923 length:1941 start_codon:yes stop_codon:yes gene_type:complete
MCGIVGLFSMGIGGEVDTTLLKRMNHEQRHRGPDGDGIFVDDGIGLGHTRLSIIDIASGHQPLFNEDDSVVVTYNGEIYNFPELMAELQKLGHRFKTRCDTEVIVHAWEEWGEACVRRFRGMFAFAVWDSNQQVLFIARDRLGIKPLFYTLLKDGSFAFSSELKALKVLPALSRKLDHTSIQDYFSFGYIPEPKTIYQSTYKMCPGHTLTLRRNRNLPQQKPYWDLRFGDPIAISDEDAEGELVSRLKEAVNIRMMSEVPLGAFLSGGVDSGAVVAMMAEHSESPVNTCSIGFDVDSFDESNYAKQVAERYQTNHFEQTVASDDFSLVDKLSLLYDEPYADSSAIPTYRVCQLAKGRVTVALSGDGGDEHLAGYRRYCWHMNEERLRGKIPLGVRKKVFGPLGEFYPKADWAPRVFRAKTTFEALARSSVDAYFHSVSLTSDQQRSDLFGDTLKRSLADYDSREIFRHYADKADTEDPLSLIQYLDVKTYLVGDILTKVDRASMAHGLEVRVPLLDHFLVEWIAQLPSSLKLRGQNGKHVFKKAMEPHLPHNVLYRRKMGFGVPLADWFRGPLQGILKQRLLGGVIAECGLFNLGFIEQVIDQHLAKTRDNSVLIWTLFMFQGFLQQELDVFPGSETSRASLVVGA